MPDPRERGPDTYDERAARRSRALRSLLVLAFAAVITASLMFLTGGPRKPTRSDATSGVEVTPSSSGTPASGSPPAKTSAVTSPSASRSTSPVIHTGNPCPSKPSCTVPGDAGMVAAVNRYRTEHHVATVVGADSTNAQACALRQGSGPTCVPHYVWTNVPAQDAALAVSKLDEFASRWMLDPATQRIDVGWAWNGRSWDCVLLKSP